MSIARAILIAFLLLVLAVPVHAAAPPWSVAVLIYRSTDVNCNGQQVTGSLQQVEADPSVVASRFDSSTAQWSGMDPAVSVFEMGTLTSVTWTGSYCWPAPSNVPLPPGYHSYLVLYDVDANDPATGLNPYGGLAYEGLFNGYTYATAPIPDGDEWWFPSNTNPELAALHEWLHGVGGYYRRTYPSIPGLHSMSAHGYTDSVAWIRDFMAGQINGSLGITPDIWDDGPPGTIAPPPSPSPSPTVGACKNPNSNSKACREANQ